MRVARGHGRVAGRERLPLVEALRADLAEHCLYLDMSFHNARTPGEMIERVDGDVNVLANFFSLLALR